MPGFTDDSAGRANIIPLRAAFRADKREPALTPDATAGFVQDLVGLEAAARRFCSAGDFAAAIGCAGALTARARHENGFLSRLAADSAEATLAHIKTEVARAFDRPVAANDGAPA